MKAKHLILIVMLLFVNMTSQVTLGSVLLQHVSGFEINENIMELSNTAKITIPKNYGKIGQKPILEQFKVGDPVTIMAGYDGDLALEFVGYIREIESDLPLTIHCDDESYILRQSNYIKSYKTATLKQVLTDILPKTLSFECPDVNLGKFHIDNESAYHVLNRIKEEHGLYSRLQNNHMTVNLRDISNTKMTSHIYTIGKNVRKNELKFKRKEDYKLAVKVTTLLPNGKKKTVEVGSKEKGASQYVATLPHGLSESEMTKYANAIYNQRCYDGYTGSIKGFGLPRTHAGDSLEIKDSLEPERAGKYLIEKVDIVYSESEGFSRNNTLSYRIDAQNKPV